MGLQTHLPVEILDYIQTHEPTEEVYGIGQQELAKALGYHPCSMSRPLGDLVSDGLLTARRGLVRDGIRRQLTYRLTAAGQERLKEETGDVPLLSGELPPPPNPFLGRKGELEQLAGYWESGASVTVVDGPPGMGKTALLSRFLRRSASERVPFWYTVRAASSPRQFVTALAHALSFLGKPQMAYYAALPRPPLPRECADLAVRALESRVLAAVVDDLQHASVDMRDFLVEFVTALGGRGDHRFFLVSQTPPALRFGELRVHRLTVGGLDRPAAYDLTNRLGGLADRFESVYQSTLGSPLLLKLAASRQEIDVAALDLPSTVVGQLSAGELRAIVPAAVANEPVPATLLLESRALTETRLKELATIGLVQLGLHDTVELVQTIRTAVLARIEPGEERAAHRSLAKFYSRSHRPETLRERFFHLVSGEEWKAAADLLRGRERELLRLGYSDALRAAIRTLVTALPPGPSKVKAYRIEGTLLRQHADFAEAVLSLRRAISQAPNDQRLQKEALLGIVELEIRQGQVDFAEQEFSRALRIEESSRSLEAFVELSKARIAEARGEVEAAAAGFQKAFEMARRAHSQDIAFEAIASWSKFAELTSGPEVALEVVKSALPGARQSGRMDLVFNLRLVRARALSDQGHHEQAEAEVDATRSEAESLGYLTQLTYALSGLAAVATERSRWAAAASYAKQASDLAERLGNTLVLGHTLATVCASEFRQVYYGGDPHHLPEALEYGRRSVEVLESIPPSDSLVFAHAYLTEVYLLMKKPAEAEVHYAKSISIANELGLAAIRDRVIQEIQGRMDEARRQPEADSGLPVPASDKPGE